MQDSHLNKHYRALSTDELLAISVSGELTETAKPLLAEELMRRGVTTKDYEHARHAQAAMAADREHTRHIIARKLAIQVVLWAAAAAVALTVKFYNE